MSRAGVTAVQTMLQAREVAFYHDLALTAQSAMEQNAAQAMKVFYSL